jgi:hypothetical protein
MRTINDYSPGWNAEDDELVRRLRTLQWAPVAPELRERCWDDFQERAAQRATGEQREPARGRAATNLSDRYDCRRFVPAGRIAVAQSAVRRYTPRTAFSVT